MRTTRLELPPSALSEPLLYQFLDSDGQPLDLEDKLPALAISRLSPVEQSWFYYNSPVIQKIDSANGIVRINWSEDPITRLLPPVITEPGEYRIVPWVFTGGPDCEYPAYYDVAVYDCSEYETLLPGAQQTPALYDIGTYDTAQYDEDVVV